MLSLSNLTHCSCFVYLSLHLGSVLPSLIAEAEWAGRYSELDCTVIHVAFPSWNVMMFVTVRCLKWALLSLLTKGERPLVLLLLVFCYSLVQFGGLMKMGRYCQLIETVGQAYLPYPGSIVCCLQSLWFLKFYSSSTRAVYTCGEQATGPMSMIQEVAHCSTVKRLKQSTAVSGWTEFIGW